MYRAGKKLPLLVLLGPTAVGKTEFSVLLAKRFATEIISGDSMLVYRGFDIGTAKPTMEERGGIVHHLLDILDPEEGFSVSEFQIRAHQSIQDMADRGKLPILAGGTGLYLKALLEGYQFNETGENAGYRSRLEELAKVHGKDYVHALLQKADPETASRLHPNDLLRVIRALEVAELGAERISKQKAFEEEGASLCYDAYVVGLYRERSRLYRRINDRVCQMAEQGLFEEVSSLLAAGIRRDSPAMKGIGYKEAAAYLSGELSREEAVDLIQKSTRHFAKRQLTWYRKMPYIHWIDCEGRNTGELCEEIYQNASRYFAAFFGKGKDDGNAGEGN